VTSRVREWDHAAASAGALARTAVVVLEPLKIEDIIAYLSDPLDRRNAWQDVFDHLRR
jgi:hypothetical protein